MAPKVKFKNFNEDYAGLILKYNTGSVRKYFMAFNTLEDVQAWTKTTLEEIQAHRKQEFIVLDQANEFVGMIAIWEKPDKVGEVSIWIKEPAQKAGYGKAALKLLIDKHAQKYRKLEYKVSEENQASANLAQSLGFKKSTKLHSSKELLFIRDL